MHYVITSSQKTLYSKKTCILRIQHLERTSNTCSTFGRPCVISPDLDFSYINVTIVSPSERIFPYWP
ncbi:unnamed protein product [Linum tenue]|uniref:Uncharacterized protein n=1 Tax=Linum tenue TaxID=586396 RepID=A0AAV0LBI0_9ROSI|nr:unnamed protein product [Linum tenue]CAI0430981.1 unnamed protein product [Linum tenue]